MNCTRLSDMSERLTTLEAKVRWSGDPGPRELEREELASAPGSPAGLSSLVPRGGCYLGPQWLWVIFSRLGQPPGVGEGSGMSKKLEGPRQQAGLGVGLSGWETGSPDADPSVERGGKSLSPPGLLVPTQAPPSWSCTGLGSGADGGGAAWHLRAFSPSTSGSRGVEQLTPEAEGLGKA